MPAVGFLAIERDANACTCIAFPPKQAIKKAAAVFIGRVTSISPVESEEELKVPLPARVTFEVSEFWKGELPKTIEVLSWWPFCGDGGIAYT
jgi:hypothetical protein